MKTPHSQNVFPIKTALTVATVALSLSAWHWRVAIVSETYPPGLDWHSLAATGKIPWLHHSAPGKVAFHSSPVAKTGTASAQAPQPPDALLIDNVASLDKFYAALVKLDAHSAHANATVVHFGDSPTTADLITGDIRQQLQQRFGDAGPGFNLIAKPWAWYQHRDIDETDKGWKFNTAVGLMREGQFGIGGVGFDGGKNATARYEFSGASPDKIQLISKMQPGGGTVEIDADEAEVATIETAAVPQPAPESATPAAPPAKPVALPLQFKTIPLPANTKAVSLKVTDGSVHLYGVIFQRNQPGLTYDSIGLNGASITVLSRAIAKDMMKQSFAHLQPDLIIINYGTNEAGFASFIDKQYEGELRLAIARVRESASDASILLMSPMDRGERGDGNAIATMDTIPKIVAIQQRVAADTGCAFFNTFQAMGGNGTMQRWYEGKPRLVGGDLIHPTPQGAKIIATAFVDQIAQGYKRYKSRIGLQPAVGSPIAPQLPSPIGENNPR